MIEQSPWIMKRLLTLTRPRKFWKRIKKNSNKHINTWQVYNFIIYKVTSNTGYIKVISNIHPLDWVINIEYVDFIIK